MDQEESLERAKADLEMLLAAYPEEVVLQNESHNFASDYANGFFPLQVTLILSPSAHVQLELVPGYPIDSNVQISSYRSSPEEKARMEHVVTAIRITASQCLDDGVEGGFACVGSALDVWNNVVQLSGNGIYDIGAASMADTATLGHGGTASSNVPSFLVPSASITYTWITGEPLHDRKSTFVAHVCRLCHESDVRPALVQLLASNNKLQKATHNMVRLVDR